MTDLAASSLLYVAQPRLTIGGERDATVDIRLLALTVEETADGLFSCEATFGNWGASDGSIGYLFFDRQRFDFGKGFTVEAGGGEAAGTIFAGRITAIEGRFPRERSPEILILAEDRFQDLRMVRRTRTFEDASLADVARQIASEHGLTAEVDADGPTWRVLAQLNQSDLAFLRDGARMVDAEVWVAGTMLHVQARARRRNAELSLTYNQRLMEFAVSADLAHQRTTVTVGGFDAEAKEAIAHEVGARAIENELAGDQSGPGILAASLGERAETLVHTAPRDNREATATAEAHFRRRARRFLSGQGLAEGDARLRAGAHVTLRGLGPLFSGTYYVCHVVHCYDLECGYRTRFSVERPGLGGQ